MTRILVTGGTGFLGKNLVRRLLAEGHAVRVLVREPGRLAGLPRERLEVFRGDLAEPASLAAAVQGVDRLIHAAALVKRWSADRTAFHRVNVEGTVNLLCAAQEARVERVVYVSSFFALGPSDGGPEGIENENLKRDPEHTHTEYERSKFLAGEAVARLAGEGLPVVTVYPCVIYGPGEMTEANIVAGMLRDHLRGKLPGIPGTGDTKWTYAYVEDVVQGILLALGKGRVGEKYILGGETVSADEFFRLFAEISGRRPPRLHLPFWLLKLVALTEEAKARLLRRNPKLTREEVETYRHNWAFDCSKSRGELGYEPRSLRDGLEVTYRWLIEREPGLSRAKVPV